MSTMITADTNVLVRAVMQDDPEQGRLASQALLEAKAVAVTLPTLCEFAWVLRRSYKKSAAETAMAIRALVNADKVVTERPAVDAGLAVLDHGGDFADGVIAYQGAWLGADRFVSFDQKAIDILSRNRVATELLGV